MITLELSTRDVELLIIALDKAQSSDAFAGLLCGLLVPPDPDATVEEMHARRDEAMKQATGGKEDQKREIEYLKAKLSLALYDPGRQTDLSHLSDVLRGGHP